MSGECGDVESLSDENLDGGAFAVDHTSFVHGSSGFVGVGLHGNSTNVISGI